MTWLQYSDDEVACFHPEFELIANDVLKHLGLDARFHWKHHPQSAGIGVVPDFALVETTTNRWWLVVEIKRTRSSVHSERSQIQAKGYAEANQGLYVPSQAKYFSVTNFEVTMLFAVNGTNPVRECRVADMTFDSGSFPSTPEASHKTKFANDLKTLVAFVVSTAAPTFDVVWPRIAKTLVSHAASLTYDPLIDLNAGTLPPVVANYFAGTPAEVPKRELLLRCLIAEYLKGILVKHSHTKSSGLPVLSKGDVNQAANIIGVLRTIDFRGIFEAASPNVYRNLVTIPSLKAGLENYLRSLVSERVDKLAKRTDALEFPEVLMAEVYPLNVKNERGKAQTDPDLAGLLSALTIDRSDAVVLDPGCGDGSLLSAAYDTLQSLGASHSEALGRLKGVEADALAAKIAALRLTLKQPYVIDPSDPSHVVPGDMFSMVPFFGNVNVVLMNPPFKRYEAHDASPIPADLRQHFRNSLAALPGGVESDVGQANIYNLYVEFVLKASDPSTVFGIILDNRWYHNKAAKKLREVLLRECEVLAVVSYPHDLYFEDWIIATTVLVARKVTPSPNHLVHFIRTNDPRRVDFTLVAGALRGTQPYPVGWHVNMVAQSSLGASSWQQCFSKSLQADFRVGLRSLNDLFTLTRSGRPDREGYGTDLYALPFQRTQYGPRRKMKSAPRGRYQTEENGPLTPGENAQLQAAANLIPNSLRGYALINSDGLTGYQLSVTDVTKDEILEAPIQRAAHVQPTYFSDKRRKWDTNLETAVQQIKADPHATAYIQLVESLVGLDETVLSRVELWHGLREPYAGELIIPRKLRAGHRVHINPFVYTPTGRQVRISSNFFHYYNCTAVDAATGLTRQVAVQLISAFLMSSFGQLQFEMEAYNREGARSIEQHQLDNLCIFDPREILPANRTAILAAANALPYPLPTDRDPRTQPELQVLDRLFAAEIHQRTPTLDVKKMLDEVWHLLAEWLEARRP